MQDIKSGSFQTHGLADLEKRLLAFSDQVAKNIMSGAVRAAAVVVQRDAKKIVPVSKKPHLLVSRRTKGMKASGKKYTGVWLRPGNLRRNIKVRLAPPNKRKHKIEYWVYVSSKYAWYFRFLELGTSKMHAKPFLRPAFDQNKERAVTAMRDYLTKRIAKEAAKR